jgi:hypothetical protein
MTGTMRRLRFLWIVGALVSVLTGYWLGSSIAAAGGHGEARADKGSPGQKMVDAGKVVAAPARPSNGGEPITGIPAVPPAWDPWQDGKDVLLPLSFFKNFNCRMLQPDQKLNEAVLAAIRLSAEQIPQVQEAYGDYNKSLREADLKHRKITRNDRDVVEIEIAAYPSEAKQTRESFKSRVKDVAGEKKAALLDTMIGMEEATAENKGLHRRVYKLMPQDDGSVKIMETSYANAVENSESDYRTLADVPIHLKHLFEIAGTASDGSAGR